MSTPQLRPEIPTPQLEIPAQQLEFGQKLYEHDWLIRTLAKGVNGLGEQAESVVTGLGQRTAQLARSMQQQGGLRSLRFPPVNGQELLNRTNYLRSFPQLIGAVEVFAGANDEHRELLNSLDSADGDWRRQFAPSDMVLIPAVCHALYPHLQGTVANGECYELTGDCFRNEPSDDPFRMVSFRMREYVLLGDANQAVAHRDRWLSAAKDFLTELGLEVQVAAANDPFFGRPGRLLASGQRAAELKFELLVEAFPGQPTAIASGNWHQDHFGAEFAISTGDGDVAHSACFGFGLERIMLALAARHGFRLADWPAPVRKALYL